MEKHAAVIFSSTTSSEILLAGKAAGAVAPDLTCGMPLTHVTFAPPQLTGAPRSGGFFCVLAESQGVQK